MANLNPPTEVEQTYPVVSQKLELVVRYWLLAVIAQLVLFGAAFLFLPNFMLTIFDWLLYRDAPSNASPFNSPARDYIIFAQRVLGAVTVGWGTTLGFIVVTLWQRHKALAWVIVTVSLLVWYVPDTFFSLTTGFSGNALLNTLFLVLFAIPLLLSYEPGYFRKSFSRAN